MRLTPKQREALELVCRTNGGGVRVRCKIGDDGYGIPTSPAYRRLFELDLIQGKAGAYETVVHTREGLAVFRSLSADPRPSGRAQHATTDGQGHGEGLGK